MFLKFIENVVLNEFVIGKERRARCVRKQNLLFPFECVFTLSMQRDASQRAKWSQSNYVSSKLAEMLGTWLVVVHHIWIGYIQSAELSTEAT